jgi:hypothetical protein
MAKGRPKKNHVEDTMIRSLDQLAAFEEFSQDIAPALRGLVKRRAKPEEIYNTVLSALAARQSTIALTSKKPAEALAAIIDIMNRVQGKPTERKEVKMELKDASDDVLDAKLKSLMTQEADDGDELPN